MTLEKWLSSTNPPYEIGIQLLKELDGNSILLTILSKSNSLFNQKKLFNRLSDLSQKITVKTEQKPLIKEEQPKSVEKPNPELEAIIATRLGSFKKMAALHQELCNIKGDSQKAIDSRYKLQLEILRLDELNEECWDKVHYYQEHGKLPDSDQFNPETLTIRELVNLEKTIPSYITKYNKELSSTELSEERRMEVIKRKADWQIKAQTIKQIIDGLPTLSKISEALC